MKKTLTSLVFASSVSVMAFSLILTASPGAALAWGGGWGGGNWYHQDPGLPPSYQIYMPNGYSYTQYVPGYSFDHQFYATPYVPAPATWSLPPRFSGSMGPYFYQPVQQPMPWGGYGWQ